MKQRETQNRLPEHVGLKDETNQLNPKKINRFAIIFISTCTVLLGTVFLITGQRPDYYNKNPVNFGAMKSNEYAVTTGLDDTGIPSIKQEYFIKSTPPSMGVYGHHIIRRLSRAAFKSNLKDKYFFNYYVPHISLRETVDLLRYQEDNGVLPSKLALIYISHPYLGLRNLTQYRWNMPIDFYRKSALRVDIISLDRIQFLWTGYISKLQFRLDWKHLAYGLFNILLESGCKKYGIYKFGEAPAPISMPTWVNNFKRYGMNGLVNKFETIFRQDCGVSAGLRLEGLKQDGSLYSAHKKTRQVTTAVLPPASTEVWTSDTANSVFKITQTIQDIGDRNNLDIVFFIPPRIAKHVPGIGHEQIDIAVSLMRKNGIAVLDTRQLSTLQRKNKGAVNSIHPLRREFDSLFLSGELSKKYMIDEEHVNNNYLQKLIYEIQNMGYLTKFEAAKNKRFE